MVKKKNREPDFGSKYFLLRAKRFRLKAYIEEDPRKKAEHLKNALAAARLAKYIRKRETAYIVYA